MSRISNQALAAVGVIVLLAVCVVFGRALRSRADAQSSANTSSSAKQLPVSTATAATTIGRGKVLYLVHCAKCHGPEGHGDSEAIARLRPPPRDFAARPWRFEVSHESISRVTSDGIPGTAMPAHRAALATADLDAVTLHVLALATPGPVVVHQRSPEEELLTAAGFTPEVVPRAAPELHLSNAAGQSRALADERGRVVLLHFWGTSCEHCLTRLPKLHALSERLHPKGLSVLHVCADADDVQAAQQLAAKAAPGVRIYVDDDGLANSRFEVHVLPTVWLIDRSGRLLGCSHGMIDWDSPAFQRLINHLF